MHDERMPMSIVESSANDIHRVLEILIPEKKQTILIVDDTVIEIDILLSILSSDYTIRVATDGESALASIHKNAPDLILLDVIMPVINGFEVCRNLKTNRDTCNIPIIFITSLNEAVDETRGLELGAVDYITKPFIPSIVKIRIKNQLELKMYREHMESLVALRTHELLEANEQLNELNNTKLDYLRAISHELRAPIRRVMGFADMSLYFANSYKACDHLLNTIDKVLYMAEFEKCCKINQLSLVNLNEIIEISINSMNISFLNLNMAVNFHPVQTTLVYGNTLIIEQIITTMLQTTQKLATIGSNVDLILHNNLGTATLSIRFDCEPIAGNLLDTFFDIFSNHRSSSPVAELGLAIPLAADQMRSLCGKISIRNIHHGAEIEIILRGCDHS
jgi:CheY-like chemotaxis protein